MKIQFGNADESDPIDTKHVQHFQLAYKNESF